MMLFLVMYWYIGGIVMWLCSVIFLSLNGLNRVDIYDFFVWFCKMVGNVLCGVYDVMMWVVGGLVVFGDGKDVVLVWLVLCG